MLSTLSFILAALVISGFCFQSFRRSKALSIELQKTKRKNQSLKKHHTLYKKAAEAAGVIVYETRFSDNSYTYLDPAIAERLDIQNKKDSHSIWDEYIEKIYLVGEHAGSDIEYGMKLFINGEMPVWNAIMQVRLHDGKVRWIMDQAIPKHDREGRIIGSTGTLRDITKDRNIQQRFLKNNYFESLLSDITVNLLNSNDEMIVQKFYSTAIIMQSFFFAQYLALIEYEKEPGGDISEKITYSSTDQYDSVDHLIPQDLRKKVISDTVQKIFVEDVIDHSDQLIVTKIYGENGEIGYLAMRIPKQDDTIYKDNLNRIAIIAQLFGILICRINDIHQKRRSVERQFESQRIDSLQLMARGITHEYSNLIASINAHLGLLKTMPEFSSTDAMEDIASIESSLDRASRLTKKIGAYTGFSFAEKTEFSVKEFIENNLILFQDHVPKDIPLLVLDDLSEGVIRGNSSELVQIILALLQNSVDASHETKGEIILQFKKFNMEDNADLLLSEKSIQESGQYLEILVIDQGKGIQEEHMSRVFEPFFSTRFIGRGVSLPYVKGMIKIMGGAISLTSVVDKGTTARILLPFHSQNLKLESHQDEASTSV